MVKANPLKECSKSSAKSVHAIRSSDKNLRLYGQKKKPLPAKSKKQPIYKLDAKQKSNIWWFKQLKHGARIEEVLSFVSDMKGPPVSAATIGCEYG